MTVLLYGLWSWDQRSRSPLLVLNYPFVKVLNTYFPNWSTKYVDVLAFEIHSLYSGVCLGLLSLFSHSVFAGLYLKFKILDSFIDLQLKIQIQKTTTIGIFAENIYGTIIFMDFHWMSPPSMSLNISKIGLTFS